MEAGAALTAATTAAASAAFGYTALITYRRAEGPMCRSRAIPLFFGIVAAFLAVAALRQVAAGTPWDQRLFLVSVVPAAYTSLPWAHLCMRVLGTRVRLHRIAMYLLAAGSSIGVLFVFIGGIEGPIVSDWGTEWRILSPVTHVMIIGAVTLPALVFSVFLLIGARALRGAERRRIRLVGIACLVYYVAFTVDAFAAPGPMLIAERVLTAWAALTAVHAYRVVAGHAARAEAARRIRELV